MSTGKKIRDLLKKDSMTVLPGAYDCITAKLIENAGFRALYMTGSGTAASRLGFPDYGLTTLTEMANNAGSIVDSVNIPLIADADNGFGNELNVIRTVHEYEKRGVAGVHIEDQTFPKKCGHLDNKEVIPEAEFVSKIKAASNERNDPDFIIIARTDARATHGFNEAIHRANAALEAGADIAFVEAPQSIEEVFEIPKQVQGPCLFNVTEGGRTPNISLEEMEEAGYKITILPSIMITTVISSCNATLRHLMENNEYPKTDGKLPVKEVFKFFGSDQWDEKRIQYS